MRWDFLYQLKTFILAICMALISAVQSFSQDFSRIYTHQQGTTWCQPLVTINTDNITGSSDRKQLLFNMTDGMTVPFDIASIDSVVFSDAIADELESKNHYKVFQLFVNTADGIDITSREEYKQCYMSLNADGAYADFSASAQIRGRGNSSFLWYDKKPLRLKLDSKHKMLGVAKAKNWVLLANYRDVTDLMNTFVFEMGRALGLPFTNNTRYVELFVNGDYRGIYQLTEQIQQNKNRVAVSDERGILLSLDVDDGPGENPNADDNFWSEVYQMPCCVKYPDDEAFTANTVDSVRTVFAELEQAIKSKNYAVVEQLLDIPSFIKYLQIQEFIYNVELSAPRSIYLHKDGDGKWVMGPLWDFDAGYDFDWSTMTTGHNYFSRFDETVMGSNPYKRNGNYNYVPQFFTDLFGCKEFVEQYKAQWAACKDTIVTHAWAECMKYVEEMRSSGAIDREFKRWPIAGKTFDTEVEKMHEWLKNRLVHMNYLIAAIPEPADVVPTTNEKLCGTIKTSVDMNWFSGFSQANKVTVNKQRVAHLMGINANQLQDSELSIVPLNSDGSEGQNHTNGTFGGWFDEDGNPGYFVDGHVYIEVFEDLWKWSCGLYQYNCYDDSHTVTMQYQYSYEGTLLKVNIEVNVNIKMQ